MSNMSGSASRIRRTTAVVVSVALAVSGWAVAGVPANAADGDSIRIPDVGLAECVNQALGGHQGQDYTAAELGSIAELSCSQKGITDLTGVGSMQILHSANFSANGITDLTPLSASGALVDLDLSNNAISNVGPVSGLNNLTTLNIAGNQVMDLSPLMYAPVGTVNATDQHGSWVLATGTSARVPILSRNASFPPMTSSDPTQLSVSNAVATGNSAGSYDISFTESVSGTDFSGTMSVLVDDQPVHVPDVRFAACVGSALGVTGNDFSASSMAALEALNCSGREIQDLTGASALTGASGLNFSQNLISDVSQLSGLTSVTALDLSHNNLTSVASLTSLSGLVSLNIAENGIADISGLSGLANLTSLTAGSQTLYAQVPADTATDVPVKGLDGTVPAFADAAGVVISNGQVTATTGSYVLTFAEAFPEGSTMTFSGVLHLGAVSQITINDSNFARCVSSTLGIASTSTFSSADLASVRSLYCGRMEIRSISGVEYMPYLVDADFSENNISDLSPLAHGQELRSLSVGSNDIADISPLENLPVLQTLNVNDNHLSDINALTNKTTIQVLKVGDNQLTSLAPVATMPGMLTLAAPGNRLTSIEPVKGLTKLQSLDVANNQLTTIDVYTANQTKLKTLDVSGNWLTSLAGAQRITSLTTLTARNNQISDLTPLSGLTYRLMTVDLGNNRITSLAPLAGLKMVAMLDVSGNQIDDVSPLQGYPILNTLYVQHNQIADLSPLASLAGSPLTNLDADGQAITMAAVPNTPTAMPMKSISGELPTVAEPLPSGVSIQGNDLTASDAGSYLLSFNEANPSLAGTPFSGVLLVKAAYHTFTAGTPTISGTAQVGKTLTVDAGAWSPSPETMTFEWYRDGVAIPDSNHASLTLTSDDAGRAITVSVTGAATGYESLRMVSQATAQVTDGTFVAPDSLAVTGDYVVGQTLSVDHGSWSPTPQSYEYQWLRDGMPIPYAMDSNYQLTAFDAGHSVAVKVSGLVPGYTVGSVVSAAKTVAAGTITGGTPHVVGQAKLWQTLTVETGTWSPLPTTWSYQWYRNGASIPGATNADYSTTVADVGSKLSVAQTGSVQGFAPTTMYSSQTDPVQPGDLSAPPSVSITGTMAVGVTLTAEPGSWGPSPVTLSYQWLRDGVPIAGATSATYTLTPDDRDTVVTVTVSGAKDGYLSHEVHSTNTDRVAAGVLVTATPVVNGSAVFGQTLHATVDPWAPVTSLSWQWLRNGVAIDQATGSNYVLGVDDIGQAISVRVTGALNGYQTTSVTSESTENVKSGTFSGPTQVDVSGELAVGKTLTAAVPSWTPTPDSVSYQWYRGANPISGATSASYTLVAADLDAVVTVKVKAVKSGYTDAVISSAAGDPVAANSMVAATPIISGNAIMGSTLTATAGAWSPAPDTQTYQWYANGVAIDKATQSTLVLGADQVGKAITVNVSGTLSGYADKTVASTATENVAPGALSGPSQVAVSGDYVVGRSLTADVGTWAPDPVNLSYQWLRAGVAVDGATSATYALTATDLNKVITVRVVATKPGFTTVTLVSAADDPVAPAAFATVVPQISGNAVVGQELSVNTGTWTPIPVTTTIQWKRDGKAIDDADASTYQVTLADVGKTISVAVTGTTPGFAPTTVFSGSTDVVPAAQFGTPGSVTVTGDMIVGKTLTADPGTWAPSPDAFSYQWYRGDSAISGADKASYGLVAADNGQIVTVKVTANKAGYVSASAESTSVTPVAQGTFETEKPTISGQARVGAVLTARPGTWSPMPTSWSYQWFRDGVTIPDAVASTFTLTSEDLGKAITVQVTGSRDGYFTPVALESDAVEVSPAGHFSGPSQVQITGDLVVGSTLTADPGSWNPNPDSFTYQWKRNAVAIDHATEASYTLTAADASQIISVQVTAVKDGYNNATASSEPAKVVALGTFTSVPKPTITGTPRIGYVLTASAGSWTPTVTTLTYQWYRSGVAISGATKATYQVAGADAGKTLSVKAVGEAAGYVSAAAVSDATTVVPWGTFVAKVPTIRGTAKVKSTLRVSVGAWSPTPDRYTYQWYRSGKTIKGATKSAYKLSKSDRKKKITVRVVAIKTGYVSKAVVSRATGKVK